MSGKMKNEKIMNQETLLLTDVIKILNLHPFVVLKMFVYDPPIDESMFDYSKLRFIGDSVKIYRNGSNSDINAWRVSFETANLILRKFFRSSKGTRRIAEEKSKTLFDIEESTKNNVIMQTSRFLLKMYEYHTINICANISKFSIIETLKNAEIHKKFCVTFQNLRNPKTEAVYADHTHVTLNDELKKLFLNFKIGTSLEFQANVYQYLHNNEKKYGIRNLRNVRLLSSSSY